MQFNFKAMYVREQKARKEGKTPLEWADARVDAVKKYYTSSDGEVLKNNLYLKMYAPMAYDYGCYMFASFNVCWNYFETHIYFNKNAKYVLLVFLH